MNIGFHVRHFDPRRGGAETYVARISELLASSGNRIHVFCETPPTSTVTVQVTAIRPHASRNLRLVSARSGLDVIVGSAHSLGMNVLHPHFGTAFRTIEQNYRSYPDRMTRLLARASDLFTLKTFRRLRFERRQFAQKAPRPHVIAVSQMVRDDILVRYDFPRERIHLVPNGVDTRLFSPASRESRRASARRAFGLSADSICFLMVANNLRLKGVIPLMNALLEMPSATRAQISVALVGSGKQHRFGALAEKKGLKSVISFRGYEPDILRAYAAADVLVHPTWWDPCSLCTLEAAACGIPFITTRYNGVTHLMKGGEGIVISSPGDVRALAEAMVSMCERARREMAGQRAREMAERNDIGIHISRLRAVYELAARENLMRQ